MTASWKNDCHPEMFLLFFVVSFMSFFFPPRRGWWRCRACVPLARVCLKQRGDTGGLRLYVHCADFNKTASHNPNLIAYSAVHS